MNQRHLTAVNNMAALIRALLAITLLSALIMTAPAVFAADFNASNEAELVEAINLANSAGIGPHTISLTADISLTAPLPSLSNTDADQITLAGGGFTLTGDGTSTVLQIAPETTAVIEALTITGGSGVSGGGIWNQGHLTVRQSNIISNTAVSGAGIHSEPFEGLSGSLVVEDSTISGNVASDSGGGILVAANAGTTTASISGSVISDNEAADLGGGVLSTGQAGETTLAITGTTVSENSSSLGGGIFNNGNGGQATLTLTDSTLSSNVASGTGGGLTNNGNLGTATATLVNVTISGNSAKNGGGLGNAQTAGVAILDASYVTVANNAAQNGDAIFSTAGAEVMMRATILAQKDGVACFGGPDNLISEGYNLATDESCNLTEPTDLPATEPGLTPLALNLPGETQTMALADDSPAIDVIPAGEAACGEAVTADQRGSARPVNEACDIGAFESDVTVEPPPPPVECTPPYLPDSEEALNEAIECVNDAGAGSHLITLAADITLTAPTTPIDNGTADDIQIAGAGFTVDGDGTGTVFSIGAGTAVTMRGLTITGGAGSSGTAGDLGGGIYNLGDLTLEAVTVDGNSAGSGGGLYSEGAVTAESSTFSRNSATGAGGAAFIQGDGATTTFFVVNSTFSGNGAAQGGAVTGAATIGSADIAFGFVTLANNSGSDGAALHAASGSTFTLGNTILDGASGSSLCGAAGGVFVSAGYNLSSDASCNLKAITDQTDTVAGIGPLQLNSPGSTATHALLEGSAALNVVPNGENTCGTQITTDQRGAARPFPGGGQCDAGAFEAQLEIEPPPPEEFILYLPVSMAP